MDAIGEKWICLGKIGKPFGLKGSFYLGGRDTAFPPEVSQVVLAVSKSALPKPQGEQQSFVCVDSHRLKGNRVVLSLSTIKSPEDVRSFAGYVLFCLRSQLRVRGEEYLWSDLIGRVVIDPEGHKVGVIESINNYGASDFVTLQDEERKRRLSIPIVPTYFDMSFSTGSSSLRLVVEAHTFEEAWE